MAFSQVVEYVETRGLIACVILVFFHTSGQKLLYKVGLIRNLVDFGCKRITGLIRLGRRKKQCDLDWKGCNQNSLWICMYAMMYLFLHTYSRTLFLKFTESHYGSRRRIKRQASFPSPTHIQCHPAMGDHRGFVTLLCYRVCK